MTVVSAAMADEGSILRDATRASGVASLSDTTIRKARVAIMLTIGATAAVIGAPRVIATIDHPGTWAQANAFAWVFTAAACIITGLLSRSSWQRASEICMIVSPHLTTAALVVTEAPGAAVVIAIAAYSLMVPLPGVAFRIRTPRAAVVNIIVVCVAYVVSIVLRMILREDSSLSRVEDIVVTLSAPTLALAIQWFMVRALNRRILEALAESERARDALGDALARQVALNDALLRFVPREFLTSLGRHELSDVQLGDSVTKTMSILFADIYGYTRLVEGMPPAATVDLLNELLGALEPAIHENHGFVDSYIGDAIMALFEGTPANAVNAALAMLAALRRYNEARRVRGEDAISIGIGIHTGQVTLGTIGGPKRFKCSVFGDSVNLAARIEHLTRRYDAPLLVSSDTLEMIGEVRRYDSRIVDKVRVVGRANTTTLVEIYNVDPEPLRSEKRRVDADYQAGVAAYYERRFSDALESFERCRGHVDDRVLRSYLDRSRALTESPPGPGWTGVEVLQQK